MALSSSGLLDGLGGKTAGWREDLLKQIPEFTECPNPHMYRSKRRTLPKRSLAFPFSIPIHKAPCTVQRLDYDVQDRTQWRKLHRQGRGCSTYVAVDIQSRQTSSSGEIETILCYFWYCLQFCQKDTKTSLAVWTVYIRNRRRIQRRSGKLSPCLFVCWDTRWLVTVLLETTNDTNTHCPPSS